VSSDDEELLPKKKQPFRVIVSASSTKQLNAAVQEKLKLTVPVLVLIFDDEFEEWVESTDLEEVPEKASVRIQRDAIIA
tara:strand:+ start:289 stop:525 length:237 start_codon:yes stop_codon:yes gene_type:complete